MRRIMRRTLTAEECLVIQPPRVSVCVPYWNRRAALEQMLDDLHSKYGSEDRWVEVSICDDGSGRPGESVAEILSADNSRRGSRWVGIAITSATLPAHEFPRCSALAINVAVESSTAPTIVIQNPETTHRTNSVLPMIACEVEGDASAYAIASCWDIMSRSWYEHPHHRPKKMHWCAGMSRSMWAKAGGIDLGLMDGHCYEDNDLRNRVHRAGARFVPLEHLVVEHHKDMQAKYVGESGARDAWNPKFVSRNRDRYLSVWGKYWPDHGGDGE